MVIDRVKPLYYGEFTAKDIAVYEAAVQDALSRLRPGMTDFDKALVLHEYLAATCAYDDTLTRYSPYHALISHSAVCQGYLLAYSDLLNRAGVENHPAISFSQNHGWNTVRLDGAWYHVDVTWDHSNDLPEGWVLHANFLRSDDGIRKTGSVHRDWTTPNPCPHSYYEDSFLPLLRAPVLYPPEGGAYFLLDGALCRSDDLSSLQYRVVSDAGTGSAYNEWLGAVFLPQDARLVYHDGSTILDITTTHTANIECSTFVTLCMRGLTYSDTSYSHVLDTAAAPADWKDNPDYYWSINPFDWNVSHLENGDNPHPTRYAAAVARWMVEHGYEVVLYGDKSNIRPGDILFFSRHSEPGGDYLRPTFYKAINHIGICYDVHETPLYDTVQAMSGMTDTDKRYVYDGDWYYYQDSEWKKGGVYVDPAEFRYTHEMIHASTDETNTSRFVPPYPVFVSSSADIGTSSQGSGNGSIFIESIETKRGDTVNGIDTLSLVCRPIPGSLWAEKLDKRIRALETYIAGLGS